MEQHTLRYQARSSLPGSFRSGQILKLKVIAACASLDLSAHVPITNDRDEGENLAVGSEMGLTERFAKYVPPAACARPCHAPASQRVTCETLIRRSRRKAVYEVMWDCQPAIAKCYSELRYERFARVL